MLGKLDAAAYPFAVIGVRGIEKDAAGASWLNATLTIKGVVHAKCAFRHRSRLRG